MAEPKVSICIPAYNNGESVQRLLDSIVQQSYCDYEVILTDDSPGNEVADVVKEYENRIPFRYYRNEMQLGPTKNCNQAISFAKGEYIKVMHHDDWFENENSLEIFVDMMQKHPDVSLAFSGTEQVGRDTRYSRCIHPRDVQRLKSDWRNLFLGNWIGAPSATIFKNEGWLFDENLKWCVDYELYMRILEQNPQFEYTELPIICIGESETQVTQSCMRDEDLRYNEHKYVYKKFNLSKKPVLLKAYLTETIHYKIRKRRDR